MTSPSPSGLPVPASPTTAAALDRTAVERVLARAAELQASGSGGSGAGDGLTEAQLLDVAREAGLSLEHVRAALVEERLRVGLAPTDAAGSQGVAGRLAGPTMAGASRVLAVAPAVVLDRLARVLERDECMVTVRRTAERAAWELRRDLVGGVMRGLRGTTGLRALRSTGGVSAAVLPLEEGRTLVRVEADLRERRRGRLVAGTATATTGVLAGGAVVGAGLVAHAVLAVLLPVAAIPVLAGGGVAWALARGHRGDVARVTEALERLLDRAETGEGLAGGSTAGSLLDLLGGVRRAIG
jgi:hypothetical protein